MWWRSSSSNSVNAVRTVKYFTEIMIASRTKEKCDTLKRKLEATTRYKDSTAKVMRIMIEELVNRPDQAYQAGCGSECGASVSGSYDHGCMPGVW